jgi:PadR family transcriptional regulator, regulatory protein PadR
MESLPRVSGAVLDVLEALLRPDDELYGLKIARNAGRKTGSVYPILARLEEAGWVTSTWEREDRGTRGPRRRLYQLNPEGLSAARTLLAQRRNATGQYVGGQSRTSRPSPTLGFLSSRRAAQ